MRFLLDCNAVIALLKGQRGFLQRLQQYQPQDFGLPTIVLHELYYGAYKSARREENLRRIDDLRFEVLDFDADDARCAGELRALLAAGGCPIGPYDVLIAGQAIARKLTLVTHNLREFQRAPGLTVADWEEE